MAAASSATSARFSNSKRYQELKLAFNWLCKTNAGALVSLTINQSNAAYGKFGENGKLFSQADVDAVINSSAENKLFQFGTVFEEAHYMLESYLDDQESMPTDSGMKMLFSRLLNYLVEDDQHKILKSAINGDMYESELAVVLAEHFFSKLGASSTYTINKSYKNRTSNVRCICGCKNDISHHFGETSIGNKKVWHGSLDIILHGYSLPVAVIDSSDVHQSYENRSENKPSVEVIDEHNVSSQLIAQTIVSSFVFNKRHPEYSNFLIPSIGISQTSSKFYFYDSENDVLLMSPSFDILDDNNELNIVVILATWFVVNYPFFCSGLTEEHLTNVKKARFFESADCMLPVYRNDLTVGCEIKPDKSKRKPYEPLKRVLGESFQLPKRTRESQN